MDTPFIGLIIMFGGNFAPRGWAFCDGQLLPISQYSALFSILGTTYGGDGRTTFALPDLRSRNAMHNGSGPGLSPHHLGRKGGTETVTMTQLNLPSHTHAVSGNIRTSGEDATTNEGAGHALSGAAAGNIYVNGAPDNSLTPGSVTLTSSNTGGSVHIDNMQPNQVVNFIIALVGTYPSRS